MNSLRSLAGIHANSSGSSKIAPGMIAATRSIAAKLSMNSAGRPHTASRKACAKRSSGIWRTRSGCELSKRQRLINRARQHRSKMIILLGASGYVGQAFEQELNRRRWPFLTLSRKQIDYSRFDLFLNCLRQQKPEFVINAAGYTGKPNVDACEIARADTLQGNTLLPQTIAQACVAADVPWGHVSSGCIFAGAKVNEGGRMRVEKDLTRPELKKLAAKQPDALLGFTEEDVPNFSFRDGPCSFYSGSKALAEEAINGVGKSYVWRLRIPFDEQDNARNYLSKVQRYAKVYENVNSVSHRGDFVSACLDLWKI